MEKSRVRAERRRQQHRVQEQRAKMCDALGITPTEDDEGFFGHLKDGHYGCGCSMCKPWKWSHRKDAVRPSERRRLQATE